MIKLFAVLFVLTGLPVFAQVEEIEARFGATTCGTCFNMAVAGLKQLPGVADVTGDAREGWIKVSVNSKQGISVQDAMTRVRIAGFQNDTQFSIRAKGALERRGERMVLVVPNQTEVFTVEAGDHEKMAMNAASSGGNVIATGWVSGAGKQFAVKVINLKKP